MPYDPSLLKGNFPAHRGLWEGGIVREIIPFWKNSSFFARFSRTLPYGKNLTLTLPSQKTTPLLAGEKMTPPPIVWLLAHAWLQLQFMFLLTKLVSNIFNVHGWRSQIDPINKCCCSRSCSFMFMLDLKVFKSINGSGGGTFCCRLSCCMNM